jgi:hypothetical protein
MHTLKLKINDRVYDHLIWLLGKFSKEEVEIVSDEEHFSETKLQLESELNEILSNNASFLTLNETEHRLEQIVRNNEDPL